MPLPWLALNSSDSPSSLRHACARGTAGQQRESWRRRSREGDGFNPPRASGRAAGGGVCAPASAASGARGMRVPPLALLHTRPRALEGGLLPRLAPRPGGGGFGFLRTA
ncbi:unnamed protein product [Closterium sp. Naga37s-1]|nr:unnamed protein product [Closterium sp. Naga37s-1]